MRRLRGRRAGTVTVDGAFRALMNVRSFVDSAAAEHVLVIFSWRRALDCMHHA